MLDYFGRKSEPTGMVNHSFCSSCGTGISGSMSEHVWTKKHQRAAAGPVRRWRKERKPWHRWASQEPWSLDDPEPTWKRCAGVPSLGLPDHFEPIEAFASNRAYPDGLYVRCRSCHKYYGLVYRARKAEQAGTHS